MDTLATKPVSLKLMLSVLLASIVAGCTAPAPKLDDNFGNAVNAAKAQQIINPDASQNTDPVAGVDGQAANSAMDRYHRSFDRPAATGNVFTIGVGSGGGSTSSGGSSGGSR